METLVFACPVCGEPNELLPEPEDGAHQEFVVDCWVCCRPLRVRLMVPDGTDGDVALTAELDA